MEKASPGSVHEIRTQHFDGDGDMQRSCNLVSWPDCQFPSVYVQEGPRAHQLTSTHKYKCIFRFPEFSSRSVPGQDAEGEHVHCGGWAHLAVMKQFWCHISLGPAAAFQCNGSALARNP